MLDAIFGSELPVCSVGASRDGAIRHPVLLGNVGTNLLGADDPASTSSRTDGGLLSGFSSSPTVLMRCVFVA
jgi:hypothetical protein